MTDLQLMYLAARAGNRRGHKAALRLISGQTGIDTDTIDRCLRRARRTDKIEARKAGS
jgi:hypothetical protein